VAEKQQIPWNRITVEATAIVASILLAFSIDAWWEERLERVDELQELERLQVEFESNIKRIDQFSVIKRAHEATREILSQVSTAQKSGSLSIVVSYSNLYRLSIAPTFEANAPVLDGLVRSGRLEIIENPGVISAIASWERNLRDYSEVALIARQNADTLLVPALIKRGDVAFALINRTAREGTSQFNVDMPTSVTLNIDTEVKGLIGQKFENTSRAISLLERAKESAEQAIIAIDSARDGAD